MKKFFANIPIIFQHLALQIKVVYYCSTYKLKKKTCMSTNFYDSFLSLVIKYIPLDETSTELNADCFTKLHKINYTMFYSVLRHDYKSATVAGILIYVPEL